jgi:hypothetical protein
MRKRFWVLLLCAAVVSGVWAFAQSLPTTAPAEPEASTDPPQAPTTLRMGGTIDRYDRATRVLSLSTANGPVKVPIAPGARIRQGPREIDAAELEKLAGYRAIVRYSESRKTVESIHVFGKNERVER